MLPKISQRQQSWLIRNKHALPGIRCAIAVALALPLAIWYIPQLIGTPAAEQPLQQPLLQASDLGAGSSSNAQPAEDASTGVHGAAAAPAAAADPGTSVSLKADKQVGEAESPAPQPAAVGSIKAGNGEQTAAAPSGDEALGQNAKPADRTPRKQRHTSAGSSAGDRPADGGPWKYWQQALVSANASGLPPPIHRGSWMHAAHARLRWFEPDGRPRYMRPWTWWAYEDPAPPPGTQPAAQAAAGGGAEATGSSADAAELSESEASDRTRDFTKRRWATDGLGAGASGSDEISGDASADVGGGSGDGSESAPQPKGSRTSGSGSSGSDDMKDGGQDSVDNAEQRRLRRLAQASDSGDGDAAADQEPADAWAARTPPLQEMPTLDLKERSHYLPWIKRDLQPWRKRGIRQSDIDAAASLSTPIGPYCYGDQLLFQIVGGRLHVEFKTSNWNDRQMPDGSKQRYDGWFPGNEGPGLAVAKGRVPYVLFMLLDVLRAFPGQVPNVSGMIHTSDFPCLRVSEDVPDTDKRNPDIKVPPHHYDGRPIPVFGYNCREGFLDLVLPDFSWYGHEYSQLTDPNGMMLNGWPQQLDVVVATHGATPLSERLPKIMWRGRAEDEPRDEVRRRFKACPGKLEAAGRAGAQELFDVVAPKIYELTGTTLLDNGRYRYPVYIDAGAFASNLKQKLAAGSPLLRVHQRYHEWYTRALVHGWTHLEVADNDTMCEDAYDKVTLMEEMIEEQAVAAAAANHSAPWLQRHADSWHQQPWGVPASGDAAAFQQLRDWTLAQRGIAAGGVNAYEDSDLYVAPPEGLSEAAGDPALAEAAGVPADAVADSEVDTDAAEDLKQQASAAAEAEDAAAAAVRRRRQRRLASHPAAPYDVWQRSSAGTSLDWLQTQRLQAQRRRWQQLWQQQHQQHQHQQRRRLRQGRQQEVADAARRDWEARQRALREAVPWGLWNRSRAAWGSDLLPWEIGAFGQMFARDRLRMHDLRLYVKDLLTEYAKLQRFDVKPSYHARCIDWERMLTEFEWPHYSKDADKLLHFYPYIQSPYNYNCSRELREADKAPYTPGHDGAGDTFKGDEGWQEEWRKWLDKKLEAQRQEREADAAKRREKEEANQQRRRKQRQKQQQQRRRRRRQ